MASTGGRLHIVPTMFRDGPTVPPADESVSGGPGPEPNPLCGEGLKASTVAIHPGHQATRGEARGFPLVDPGVELFFAGRAPRE